MHSSEERKSVGHGSALMADDAASGCTEEERVAVEQLRELRRRIRKFSGPQTGYSEGSDAIEDGDGVDREGPVNEDSNSEPESICPCSSLIAVPHSARIHPMAMYNPRWKKMTQYKCGSYVVSSGSSRNKHNINNNNNNNNKNSNSKGELGSVVESPLEQRKYGVHSSKNAIINSDSHGMISASKHTHKRMDQPAYHHHHHHHRGDADSIGIDSTDIDSIGIARPQKKTRLLTDIYQQKSKPTGTVHGDLANAHCWTASVIESKRKVVHMKGRRKSLNWIMGERDS
jgi:hypothetical protein